MKNITGAMSTIVVASLVLATGCAIQNGNEAGTMNSVSARVSTPITHIKQYYATHREHIVGIHPHSSEHAILVVWNVGDSTIPNRYDWWDTKTQTRFAVPSGTAFTKIVQTSSKDIKLMATGPNDIDSLINFPFIIDDSRPDDTFKFQMTDRPYYLKVKNGVEFGDHHTCAMTSLFPTVDGLQATFGPTPEEKNSFYAGAAGCPTMDTSYDTTSHTFTIRFKNTVLSDTAGKDFFQTGNDFVKSGTVMQNGTNVVIRLKLKSKTAYYNAKQGSVYTQDRNPYVTFHFADDIESTYPMIEQQ